MDGEPKPWKECPALQKGMCMRPYCGECKWGNAHRQGVEEALKAYRERLASAIASRELAPGCNLKAAIWVLYEIPLMDGLSADGGARKEG
jgi:hypothetical protein